MNLAPAHPAPRAAAPRPPTRPATSARDRPTGRPVKSRAGAVRRERHQADYVILVVVVALTAIGILMVYSSSALKGYLSQDADTFATVGPQIQWAILGIVAMAVMMRVDYRYLRLASVPFYVVAIVLLVLVFVPAVQHRRRRLGALAEARPAAGDPPGRDRQARPGHLPRPLVRQAREAGPRLLGRDRPVPDHRRAGHRPGLQGARPRDDRGHHADRVHDVLRRRGQPHPPRGDGRRARCWR